MYPYNQHRHLDAATLATRPFMLDLEPLGYYGLLQADRGPAEPPGLYADDRGRLLWLRTVENVWLVADMDRLRPVTLKLGVDAMRRGQRR